MSGKPRRNNYRIDVQNSAAMSFCWFIWEKGYKGDTILKWFN